MFEATRIAKLVSHNMSADPGRGLSSEEAFRMATVGGATLMGLDKDIGLLRPGYLADIVFLDRNHLNYIPLDNALHQIVFMENGAAVRRVMVGGKTVFADGAFAGIDLAALRRQLESAVDSIRAQVQERKKLCEALAPVLLSACLCMTAAPRASERRFECA